MSIRHWIGVGAATVVLSGCAATGEKLAAVGLFNPTGLRGQEHCETSNHCVIRTDDSGLIHVSIGDQSAVTIGFSGLGGDVRHYFDYLVTIQNIGENDLVFDPVNVPGYDERALLESTRKEEKELVALSILTGISMGLGNTGNVATLEYMGTTTAQERSMKESHVAEQKLVAQVIPPGGVVTGRLIVKATAEIPDEIVLSIPVGQDIHTVRFNKRDLGPILGKMKAGSSKYVADDFSFDGRWLLIWGNGAYMDVCFFRTEGNNIYEECEGGGSASGTFEGGVATFPSTQTIGGSEVTVIDQDTLMSRPLQFEYIVGKTIYERQ